MEIKTRVPGMIQKINVKVGDQVKAKDVVAVMEAMKMEQNILAPADGEVTDVAVEAGERVRAGAVLMTVE
ncbi:MAG: acetyl-CoA carboxylase biotin carboxyl carrier protein subunit [Lawsonibacter sp.]|nr:acetyl-CoA carboxylase biotin carboxyl carrier protein subunit [Lawsonibacter sp.]